MPDEGGWKKKAGNKGQKILNSLGAMVRRFRRPKRQRNTTVKRIFYDLIIGVIGLLFYQSLSEGKIVSGIADKPWVSIMITLSCGFLYDIHNTFFGERIADLAVKKISPILDASSKIPNLKDYANALGAVNRFDKIVITRVLSNHSELLARNRYLMSFDGYLALLTELSDRYSSMVCVNRTLPINWLAPIHGKDSSTRDYETRLLKELKSGRFEARRLTISSKDEINKQLTHTYESLRRSETEPFHCVLWFLEFFQALFDSDQDGLITQVSKYFDQHESDVKDILVARADELTVENLLPRIEGNCASAARCIEKDFIHAAHMRNKLNKHILRKFFDVHGRCGSYYMTKKNFDERSKETLKDSCDVSKYGEIAVYYSREVPKMAIATVGELGELVGIEIAESSNLAVCINNCINIAEDRKQTDFAGNFKDLITNDV